MSDMTERYSGGPARVDDIVASRVAQEHLADTFAHVFLLTQLTSRLLKPDAFPDDIQRDAVRAYIDTLSDTIVQREEHRSTVLEYIGIVQHRNIRVARALRYSIRTAMERMQRNRQ